jgi:predicted transcriptional regulator
MGERLSSNKNNISESRRNLLEFFAEILDCCMVPQAATKVMCKANLSPKITTEIIKQLKSLGLLEDNQNLGKFVTTTRGNEYLRR